MAIDTKSAFRRAEAANVFGQAVGGGIDMIRDIILKNMENKKLTAMQRAKWEQSMKMLQLKHGFSMAEIGAKEGAISGRATLERELKREKYLQDKLLSETDDKTKKLIAAELNKSREWIAVNRKVGGGGSGEHATEKELKDLKLSLKNIPFWEIFNTKQKDWKGDVIPKTETLPSYIKLVSDQLDRSKALRASSTLEGQELIMKTAQELYNTINQEANNLDTEKGRKYIQDLFDKVDLQTFSKYSNISVLSGSPDMADTLNREETTTAIPEQLTGADIANRFKSLLAPRKSETEDLKENFLYNMELGLIPKKEIPAWEEAYKILSSDVMNKDDLNPSLKDAYIFSKRLRTLQKLAEKATEANSGVFGTNYQPPSINLQQPTYQAGTLLLNKKRKKKNLYDPYGTPQNN